MVCGLGDNTHKGHPPMGHNEITNRKRFLGAACLENIAAMAATNIQPAQAMAYVQGFSRMAQSLMDSGEYSTSTSSASSPSDNMLKYLQKIGASYVCLYHNGKTRQVRGNAAKAARMEGNDEDNRDQLTSLSVVVADEIVPSHKSISLDDTDNADCNDYAQKSRHAVGARDDQDILIACCWVLPDARRLFQAFPEVLCVDGTHQTNNESRPLLTFSVKDSDGKVTVVLRCFAPNERSWFFRWLFQQALPVLLGRASLKKVA